MISQQQQNLILILLVLIPITYMLGKWGLFHLGRFVYLTVVDKLGKRSKLRTKLIQIIWSNRENENQVYTLVGFLLFWLFLALVNLFL